MKQSKNLIIIGIILIIASFAIFIINNNNDKEKGSGAETKTIGGLVFNKKYGNALTAVISQEEVEEEVISIPFEGVNETLNIGLPKSSELGEAEAQTIEYDANTIKAIITKGFVDSNADVSKVVYDDYKENSKEIAVYEYKDGDNIYIFEQSTRDDEVLPYVENLILYKIYKTYSINVRYELYNFKFSDKLIEQLIKEFKSTAGTASKNEQCVETSGKYKCNAKYHENYEFEAYVDSTKYNFIPQDSFSSLPLEFETKEKDENKKISVSINALKYTQENLISAMDEYYAEMDNIKDLKKNNVTINGTEYVTYSYTYDETKYREYLFSDGGIYTFRISIGSIESPIDNVINDFTNYKIISTIE